MQGNTHPGNQVPPLQFQTQTDHEKFMHEQEQQVHQICSDGFGELSPIAGKVNSQADTEAGAIEFEQQEQEMDCQDSRKKLVVKNLIIQNSNLQNCNVYIGDDNNYKVVAKDQIEASQGNIRG